jgi:uncharacterized protein (DUF1330 family)
MPGVREEGEAVRQYILTNIEKHPEDIAKTTAQHFSISKQAVNRHLGKLIQEGLVSKEGRAWTVAYKLAILQEWTQIYPLNPRPVEDQILDEDVLPIIGELSKNVLSIWSYGFTEMFNNAIDHSAGSKVIVQIRATAIYIEMLISDDGIGIFKKIQNAFNLSDERHAVLALAKGKLTTDPEKHSGQGIFFTSRFFDSFDIISGGVYYSHTFGEPEDWILEKNFRSGTSVWLKLDNKSTRSEKEIIDQYSTPGSFEFDKTVVPVKLTTRGGNSLVSRSEAKRLMAQLDVFKVVVLDFKDVDRIGQGFADEVFRVFRRTHPDLQIEFINANADVLQTIKRAGENI